MPQHLADGLDRNAGFQGNQRCKRVPADMVGQVFLDVGKDSQTFHEAAHIGIVQHREESLTVVIPVFLYQGKGFGQQLDTGTKLVFLAAVFKPQPAIVIREQIVTCNGNGIGVGCSRIAGKEKEISCQDMGGAMFGDYQVTDFLEGFSA